MESAETFVLYDQCGDAVRQIQGEVAGVEAAAWRYQARPGFDNERRLQNAFDGISRRVVNLIQSSQGRGNESDPVCAPFKNKVTDLALAIRRARTSVDVAVSTKRNGQMDLQALERAREALVTLSTACDKLILQTRTQAEGSHDVLRKIYLALGATNLSCF